MTVALVLASPATDLTLEEPCGAPDSPRGPGPPSPVSAGRPARPCVAKPIAPTPLRRMVRRQGVRDRDAVDVVHQQGGRRFWTGLVHHGDRPRHGHVGLSQRRQDPVLPLDAVRARVDRRARRAAQHPLGHPAADQQRLVGVAAGERARSRTARIAADPGDPRGEPRRPSALRAASCMADIVAAARVRAHAWPGTVGVGSKGGSAAVRRRPASDIACPHGLGLLDRARVRAQARVDARASSARRSPAGDARARPPGVPAHRQRRSRKQVKAAGAVGGAPRSRARRSGLSGRSSSA